ncbi:Crp/Fnr family transcriptional regulator [Bradyrhizobium sp.]|uniref:Crp/Fnr family transcriptional regulator n=1 Tax=Bradyrhizobium sp. TaxID=376 RepID=UPI003C511DAE
MDRQSHLNRLLQLLDTDDSDRLRAHLAPVKLDYRQPLYEANEDIPFVYFPIEGVASLINTMENGSAAEVGTVGNEGMVGLPVILGDRRATTSAYIQVPGSGLRLRADILRNELKVGAGMRTVMLHYAHAFFNQVAQSAACAHFHSIEQRCCRWLLMTHDRVQSDQFLLTQEFLGMMLGVRRTSVTEVAAKLKHRKFIEYNRGHVTILDRAGLERHACECYLISKREFDRLLGHPLEPR